ncbi:MAG: ABC transporter substrate-binding protein, partial [Methanocorpusculum sp.]|nr:ABC transporter substrate-binding protein [Methanocorpusculum sp.]
MKKLHKIFLLSAGIFLLALVLASSGCVDSKPVYTVGFDPSHAPYTEMNESGIRTGLDYDALMWIAEDQGFRVKFVDVAIGSYPAYLADGSIDMFYSGVTVTEARKNQAAFTEPYLYSNLIAIAKKGGDVTCDDVLAGKVKVSGLTGSVGLKWFEELVGTEKYTQMLADGRVTVRITFQGALQDVEVGIADVAITNDVTAETYLLERPHLMSIGIIQADTTKAVAVNASNAELLRVMNAGLANLTAAAYWQELLAKYGMPAVKSVYRVGIDDTHKPYSYYDEAGQLVGFDVDSLRWIAKRNGFEVEFVNSLWTKNINAIVNGEIDMFYSGMTITQERMDRVTFSDPYFSVGMSIAKLAEKPFTVADFASRKMVVGVQSGTTPEKWVRSYFGRAVFEGMVEQGKVKLYATNPEIVAALLSGEIDGLVMNDVIMRAQIEGV